MDNEQKEKPNMWKGFGYLLLLCLIFFTAFYFIIYGMISFLLGPSDRVETPWIEHDLSIDAFVMSQESIRARLKAPSTAKFPYIVQKGVVVERLGAEQKYRVRAYVDAQNSFGAMIRQNYTATVQFLDESNRCKVSDVLLY